MADKSWITRCYRVQAKAGAALMVSETPGNLAVRLELISPDGKTVALEMTKPQWDALCDLGRSYGSDRIHIEDEPEMVEAIRAAGLDALPEPAPDA